MFLTSEQVSQLTGCKRRARQIAWLRNSGLAFFINAAGWPVVPSAQIEGRKGEPQHQQWIPAALRRAA